MVGLGKAALDKGYKRVMVIAEDYAFPYSQVQGFMTEYCKLGGKVPVKAWVPLGGKDYSSVIARIPEGRRRAGGGAGRRRRGELPQPVRAGGRRQADGRRLDHGRARTSSTTRASAATRWSAPSPARRSPTPTTAPEWKKFVADYKKNFTDGYPSPSLFAFVYYINMKAALDGLEAVKGDLSGRARRSTARRCEDDAQDADRRRQARREPPGDRHHLHHRGGEGRRRATSTTRCCARWDNVDQTLGMPKAGVQDRLARRAQLP